MSGVNELKLFAIVCHYGETIESGHYNARVQDEQGLWILCDDMFVQKHSLSQFTEDTEKNCYMLFYVKSELYEHLC